MDKDGIIAMSPTLPACESTLAHRMVIREVGDEYVVHMQIFNDDGTWFFHQGNYFRRRREIESANTPDWEALRKAYACFDRRSRLMLGVGREEGT